MTRTLIKLTVCLTKCDHKKYITRRINETEIKTYDEIFINPSEE